MERPRATWLIVALVASSARAEPISHPVGHEQFERAERLYVAGQFEAALAEYAAAYESAPRPELLFHIGQCQRRLGRHEEAVFFFRGYLERVADAPDRAQVVALIAEEEEALAQAGRRAATSSAIAAAPAPATGNAAERSRHRWWRSWWVWTGATTVVVAGGVGLGLGLSGEPGLPAGGLGTIDARH